MVALRILRKRARINTTTTITDITKLVRKWVNNKVVKATLYTYTQPWEPVVEVLIEGKTLQVSNSSIFAGDCMWVQTSWEEVAAM